VQKPKSSIDLYFTVVRFVIDCLLMLPIVWASFYLKFKLGWGNRAMLTMDTAAQLIEIQAYTNGGVYLGIIWLASFYFCGVYQKSISIMAEVDAVMRIFKATLIALVMTTATTFFIPIFPESRVVLIYVGILGIVLFSGIHIFLLKCQLIFWYRSSVKVVVVGHSDCIQDLIERMVMIPSLSMLYSGSIVETSPKSVHYAIQSHFKILGQVSDLNAQLESWRKRDQSGESLSPIALFASTPPDQLFISSELDATLQRVIRDYCVMHAITLNIVPEYPDIVGYPTTFNVIDQLPFISINRPAPSGFQWIMKRCIDYGLSIIAIVGLSPVFLLIAGWVKWVSPDGSVIYSQERVGKDGRVFGFHKFRTMSPDAEKESGPVFVSETNETRYIPGGQFLRRFSLDELPQLFNVLKGQMSLVGPRPERPVFVKQNCDTIPHYAHRHLILGGLTGWAQINGRSQLTRNVVHKTRYDLHYIYNWSLVWDIKIMIKTIFMVVKGENAF
jgi:exopolysaccharide biosynthesis polyprenyl glycosylphosphotransferase